MHSHNELWYLTTLALDRRDPSPRGGRRRQRQSALMTHPPKAGRTKRRTHERVERRTRHPSDLAQVRNYTSVGPEYAQMDPTLGKPRSGQLLELDRCLSSQYLKHRRKNPTLSMFVDIVLTVRVRSIKCNIERSDLVDLFDRQVTQVGGRCPTA